MIRYRCPHCGADVEVPDSLAGHEYACPSCERTTMVVGAAFVGGITHASSSGHQAGGGWHGAAPSHEPGQLPGASHVGDRTEHHQTTVIVEQAGPSPLERTAGCGCMALDGCMEGCFFLDLFMNCVSCFGGCLAAVVLPLAALVLFLTHH
jgi:DNA-directed RNA polymerase subunit RPC12/RpoP